MDGSSSSTQTEGRFRLRGKCLFLTYPRCTVNVVTAERTVRAKLAAYEWSVWAREYHVDGTPHLHAIVHLRNRCDLNAPNCLDLVDGDGNPCHGNYSVARNPKEVLDYVCKGGVFTPFGAEMDFIRSQFATGVGKRTRMEDVFGALKRGKTLYDVVDEDPSLTGTCAIHGAKIEAFYHRYLAHKASPPQILETCAAPLGSPYSHVQIATWITNNVLPKSTRTFGTKQLWIYGTTMLGKTTLLRELSKSMRIYWTPKMEDFYDSYEDAVYDLIVIDEFKHHKSVQWMNEFVDGTYVQLRKKGSQVLKRKNLPVIVCSNYSIRENYPHVDETAYDALARRFLEVKIETPLELIFKYAPEAVSAFESL